MPPCILGCDTPHYMNDCKFDTPVKRRNRLVLLNKCQACSVPLDEHGCKCCHKAKCSNHPNAQHMFWTCDGKDFVQPGPEEAFKALSTRSTRGGNSR